MAQNTNAQKPKPVHEIRIWPVKVAIWKNGEFYNCTASKSYKDSQTEEYHDTTSFGRDDLLPLAKAIDHAHSWILRQEQKDRAAKPEGQQ